MLSDSEDEGEKHSAKKALVSDDEEPGPSELQKENQPEEKEQAPAQEDYDSDEGIDRNV